MKPEDLSKDKFRGIMREMVARKESHPRESNTSKNLHIKRTFRDISQYWKHKDKNTGSWSKRKWDMIIPNAQKRSLLHIKNYTMGKQVYIFTKRYFNFNVFNYS